MHFVLILKAKTYFSNCKALKQNKKQERTKGIEPFTQESPNQQNQTKSRYHQLLLPAGPGSRSLNKAVLMAKAVHRAAVSPLLPSSIYVCFSFLFKEKGNHHPFILLLLLHDLVIPIYTWSCSSILVAQEPRGHVQSSREGLPVQRGPELPSHDLYRRNVDRTHRRKQLHCCTHCTDATGTPTFLTGRIGGEEPKLVPVLISHKNPGSHLFWRLINWIQLQISAKLWSS